MTWDNNKCISCLEGQYSPPLNNTCIWCPPNAKVNSIRSGCLCSSGLHWNISTLLCEACLPNTYINHNTCVSCPVGSTSGPGSSYCTCLPGMYWEVNACKACPAGSYSYGNKTFCMKCPEGATSKMGADRCACSSGLYWDARARGCGICVNGTYSEVNSTSCKECPNNTYSYLGADHCICPKGQYWRNNSCYLCPSGTYSRKEGSIICILCPKGSTSSPGSVSCKCNSQELWDEYRGSCAPCPYNSYYDSNTRQCRYCLNGTISNGKACLCPSGMYMSSNFSCEHILCNGGEYWDAEYSRCSSCPNNTISKGGQKTTCILCPDGTHASKDTNICICDNESKVKKGDYCDWCPNDYIVLNGSCIKCPDNMYSPISVNYCSCPVGHHLINNVTCAPCPVNQFSSHANSSSCSHCPNNSLSTGTSCQCKSGYKWENEECKPCKVGFYSSLSGECLQCPRFQTSTPASTFCYFCRGNQFWNSNYTCQNCSENTVGNGVTCLKCPHGFVSFGNLCVPNSESCASSPSTLSTTRYIEIITLGSIGGLIITVTVLIFIICQQQKRIKIKPVTLQHSSKIPSQESGPNEGITFQNKGTYTCSCTDEDEYTKYDTPKAYYDTVSDTATVTAITSL